MGGNFFQSDLWQIIESFILPWTAMGESPGRIFLNWLVFALLQATVLWSIARFIAYRHDIALDRRERADGRPMITTTPDIPDGYGNPAMLCGSVVIAHATVRALPVFLSSVIGGNIRVLEQMLNRARREALLRLEEEALARRADLIVNLRFISHNIGSGKDNKLTVEIAAFGTAVQRLSRPSS